MSMELANLHITGCEIQIFKNGLFVKNWDDKEVFIDFKTLEVQIPVANDPT